MVRSSSRFAMISWVLLFACVLTCIVSGPREGSAQTKSSSLLTEGLQGKAFLSTTQGEWQIEAATLSHDQNNKIYEASGNVRITSENRVIQADWARLDNEKREVELRGKVYLKYGKDWIKGEHIFWKLDDETGSVDDGLVYFAENHFYVKGKSIVKTGEKTYEMKEGYVTTCNPLNPDWKVRYEGMKINMESLAWAKNASFWAFNMPLFYSPVAALPIETERQSGFLLPWGGFSKLNGYQGEIPFYWAIRQDMDATFYAHAMTERGVMLGGEYRITNKEWGEGIWLFNYLDDHVDRSHLADNGFSAITTNRYWLRSRHSFELPSNIEGRLDLDWVSDRNYLDEFTRGSGSYTYSNRIFRELFGRGILNDQTILARESALYLDKRGESSLLSLDVRYWDELNTNLDQTTLQRLPALAFNVIPSGIDSLPFYYTLDTSLVNYWRREGDNGRNPNFFPRVSGDRLDVFPKVGYPLHWGNYLNFEPSVGVRGTSYMVDWQERQGKAPDDFQGRFFPDVRVEMDSRLNRVYDWNLGSFTGFQHTIRPEVVYEYVPENLMGTLPHFDRLDGEQARHDIRYGFTTFLTGRETRNDAEGNPITKYRELARLQLFQLFNFEKPPQITPDPIFGPVPSFDTEALLGFADVGLRLDVMPKPYVMLSYSADFSPEKGQATIQDVFLTLKSGRGDTVRFNYVFRNDLPVDEFITDINVKVVSNLYLNTYHDYSFQKQNLFRQGYGVRYIRGCWAVALAYEREAQDERVAFSIDLLGLGTYGQRRLRHIGETLSGSVADDLEH